MNSQTESTRPECDCNWLHNAATASEMPFIFNPEMNEFDLQVGKHLYRIHYCPFCGGRTPKSLRETFFAIIPPEEEQRLKTLESEIHSLDEALQQLGEADVEYQTFVYSKLSETADIRINLSNGEFSNIFHMRKNIRKESRK